ncbi:glycogenin-2 isoform X2 [Bos taurus]|uniref:glycogenin-2 isoform X2 n=1 Tax=Bos taurus TaxID=9913 RepID=UPI0028CB97E1|nr:glycogenin-2 isoform X2 [Bos taurus]
MHSLITVFSPSSTQVHPPALRFSPSPSLISPSLLRPSTVHAARTHALSTPRAHSSSAHHTFPPYDHVSSVASAPGRALAWGPEASANIDFGGGVLKVRGFRARTPQTPGFRGEGPEGAGRGVRGARLQALPSRGPQPGHQARRAAGAGRAGDPRPGAELTVWRAAHLWAARRPAHPGQQLRERGEVSDQAFVTLATNDVYCQGALVLGQSLREHRATRRLVVLVTPQVSNPLRVILSRVFDEVIEVNLIDSADYVHLAFLKRPDLGITLTKLHCWTLTRYSKCVFLDADTLVLSNIDELFDRREFSAAPDPGWPDCFNSGVFVFQPSLETHSLLLQHATDHGSFDGADQGLLNSFFSNWSTADIQKHLPFIYNLSSNTTYTYSPAFKQFGSSAKVVHFLGSSKPWNCKYNPQTGSVLEEGSGRADQHQTSFLNQWWGIYHRSILPLCEDIRNKDHHAPPGHTAHLGGAGVPCSSAAAAAEGSCANPAEGPRQACSADASERIMGVEEDIPTRAACPSEEHLPLGPGNASCGLSRKRPPCRNVNTLWIKPLGSCRTASLLCQQEPPPQWEFKIRKTEVYSIYHTVVSLACPAECFSHLFFFRLFSMTGYITTY